MPRPRADKAAGNGQGKRQIAADSDGAEARQAISEQAHLDLRKLILTGELPAGEEFTQSELGRLVDVGRTPLRDALRLLEREGLIVNTGPHRSVRISPLSMPDLDDLYSMRLMGEALATWMTVPVLRTADFDRLSKELELIEKGDREAHRRFHASFRSAAGPRLIHELEVLSDHAERYQWAALAAQPDDDSVAARLAEHRPILEAAIARDRELTRNLMVDHLAATAQTLMAAARHAPYTLPNAIAMAKAGWAC